MSKKETAVRRERAEAAAERTPKKRTVTRSAKSGEIVKKGAAAADPDGTITQVVMPPIEEFLKKFKAPTKIPKNFGAVADLLYITREDRLALSKAVQALEDYEKSLKAHLIENMSKKDSTGASGHRARAQIVMEPQPQVQDWDEFYKHIKKKGEFDLLNRAVNRAAVKARWENGKEVPGVGSFNVAKVSVTKL